MKVAVPPRSGEVREKLAELTRRLRALFITGVEPMPPKERVKECKRRVREAQEYVAGVPEWMKPALREELRDLEEAVENAEEAAERIEKRISPGGGR